MQGIYQALHESTGEGFHPGLHCSLTKADPSSTRSSSSGLNCVMTIPLEPSVVTGNFPGMFSTSGPVVSASFVSRRHSISPLHTESPDVRPTCRELLPAI
ncbi:hypothetical protein B566_EDAN006682 [Ephemera danica]|nr:hypothetical protein B566_EDAN006682 [Ephemera danica]